MPIKSWFESNGNLTRDEQEDVAANKTGVYKDYSGWGKIVLYYCCDHDMGGVLYILDREAIEIVEGGSIKVQNQAITSDNTVVIGPGEPFSIPVENEKGETGNFRGRHEMPNEKNDYWWWHQ